MDVSIDKQTGRTKIVLEPEEGAALVVALEPNGSPNRDDPEHPERQLYDALKQAEAELG